MKDLLNKELKLTMQPITYCFLAFSLMTLLPGYPILLGVFFLCLGIFQSFQRGNENHDILYTVLLPIRKSDAVKAKFISVCFIEMAGFLLMVIFAMIRMTFLSDAPLYVHNALMNANPLFLGFAMVLFAVFNLVFVRGFFKTAYKYGVPFLTFIVIGFLVIGLAEALHFFPNLHMLNATALQDVTSLWPLTAIGAAFYAAGTWAAYKSSVKKFEKVDF